MLFKHNFTARPPPIQSTRSYTTCTNPLRCAEASVALHMLAIYTHACMVPLLWCYIEHTSHVRIRIIHANQGVTYAAHSNRANHSRSSCIQVMQTRQLDGHRVCIDTVHHAMEEGDSHAADECEDLALESGPRRLLSSGWKRSDVRGGPACGRTCGSGWVCPRGPSRATPPQRSSRRDRASATLRRFAGGGGRGAGGRHPSRRLRTRTAGRGVVHGRGR